MAPVSPTTERPNGASVPDTPTNGFTAVNERQSPPNGASQTDSTGRPRSSNKESWQHQNGDASHSENPNKRRYIDLDAGDHPPPSITSPTRSRGPVDASEIDPRVTQSQPGAVRDLRWDPEESRMAELLRQETTPRMDVSPQDSVMRTQLGPDLMHVSKTSTLVTTAAGVQQDPSKKRKRAFTNRTKTGCQTCRKRKKKCDEGKPECQNCLRGGFNCLGYTQRRDVSGKQPLSIKASVVPIQSRQYWEPNTRSSPHSGYETNGMSVHSTPDGRHPPFAEDPSSHLRPFPWNGSSLNGPPRSGSGERMSEMRSLPPIFNSRNASSYAPMMATEHARAALRVGWEGNSSSSNNNNTTTTTTTSNSNNNRGSPLPGSDSPGDTSYGNVGHYKPNEPLRTMRRRACQKACGAFNNAANNGMSESELQRLFSQIIHPENSMTSGQHDPHNQKHRLGKDVRVEAPFKAEFGENLHIGDGVTIDTGCYFKDSCTTYIANNTRIGANVTISAEWVPPDPKWREWSRGVIVRIGENVYIGPGVLIAPSGPTFKPEIVIGDGAYIAAGTVVTRDVPKAAYVMPSYTFSITEDLASFDDRNI